MNYLVIGIGSVGCLAAQIAVAHASNTSVLITNAEIKQEQINDFDQNLILFKMHAISTEDLELNGLNNERHSKDKSTMIDSSWKCPIVTMFQLAWTYG